jgi:RNA polymerase sigma factor (sigma-70 family)
VATTAHAVLGYLRSYLAHEPGDESSDRDLLRRFVAAGEGEAFARLLERHGPMVLGLARRVVRDAQLAEDVFQATFLTLARKAGSIRRAEALPCWLHGVAFRLSLRARQSRRRQQQEACRPLPPSPSALDELTAAELLAVLDEELAALPERDRGPLLLCCLEGLSQDEAAKRLGCSTGAVRGRLERGRARLRLRLEKRGLGLPAVLAGSLLVAGATQAVSPVLMQSTFKAALTGLGVSPAAAALAQGAIQTMTLSKMKVAAAVFMLLALSGVGLGMLTMRPATIPEEEPDAPLAKTEKKAVDLYGDPLPEGAVRRFGTLERRAVGAKLAMTSDGQSIIGVRAGKYVYVWDVETGKLQEQHALPSPASDFHLSPDGRWLVTGEVEREAWTVSQVKSGKIIHNLKLPPGYVRPVVFSPDNRLVAMCANQRGQIAINAWELASGKEVFAANIVIDTSANQLAFSADGKLLLVSLYNPNEGTRCWDVATGKRIWHSKDFFLNYGDAVAPDGVILTTDPNRPVVDLVTGERKATPFPHPYQSPSRLSVTPDGLTLLATSSKGVAVWNLKQGKELLVMEGAGTILVPAPDRKSIITNNGMLQRWDLRTGKPLYPDNWQAGHLREIVEIGFSADGTKLASASLDGSVRMWDVATARQLDVFGGNEDLHPPPRIVGPTETGVTALAMTPDARWLATGDSREKLVIWSAKNARKAQTLDLPPLEQNEGARVISQVWISSEGDRATAVFAPNGGFGGPGQTPPKLTPKLATWDLRSGKLLSCRFAERMYRGNSGISNDGHIILCHGVIMDARTSQQLAQLDGLNERTRYQAACLSQDGRLVAGVFPTDHADQQGRLRLEYEGVRVWDSATGRTVSQFKTSPWPGELAFHPNNRFVAANTPQGIEIYDIVTGTSVATIKMHETICSTRTRGSYASCLAFTPDGRYLATGHPDSTILLWPVPLPATKPEPLAANELEVLWTDLANADAGKAWRAVWRLSDFPKEAVTLLRGRIETVPAAPADETRSLLTDLDSDAFAKREAALSKLKKLGPAAEPALRQALQNNPSLEKKRRIEELLTSFDTPTAPTAEELRALRAVTVLERVGSPAARAVLADLAAGIAPARLTQAAKGALNRLQPPASVVP